jgi:hypothetical protein
MGLLRFLDKAIFGTLDRICFGESEEEKEKRQKEWDNMTEAQRRYNITWARCQYGR